MTRRRVSPVRSADPSTAVFLSEIDSLARKAANPDTEVGRHVTCTESMELAQRFALALDRSRQSSDWLTAPVALLPPLV